MVLTQKLAFSSSDAPAEPDEATILAGMATAKAKSKQVITPTHVRAVPDGLLSNPENPVEVATLDGMPSVHRARTVIISQKCKSAMTSALGRTKAWHITWTPTERWSNPLMGWTSTADPLSNSDIQFETAEQAVRFATKCGWKYDLHAPLSDEAVCGKNKYAYNFLPRNYDNQIQRYGKKQKIFAHKGKDESHYFRPLKYHGEGECRQHGLEPEKPWKE